MTTTPDTTARLAYILAHPRVRDLRPGWYAPACPVCGRWCDGTTDGKWICIPCRDDVPEPVYRFDGYPDLIDGDLADPDNFGKLLALADEVAGENVSVRWNAACKHYYCDNSADRAATRSAAVINMLYRALGRGRGG